MIEHARKIVKDYKIKYDVCELVKEYNDNIIDIVTIFVTKDWQADAFWGNLTKEDALKVIDAFKRGLEKDRITKTIPKNIDNKTH